MPAPPVASPARRERSGRRARSSRPLPPARPARDPLLLLAAAVGLLVSAYLSLVDLAGGSALCLAGSDCDAVRGSAYGSTFGVPVALLGVGFFATALAVGLLDRPWQPRALQILGGIGAAAAVVFVGLQAGVLGAWCPWCLVADAAALVVAWRALRPSGHRSARRALAPGLTGASLALAVLLVGYAGGPVPAGSAAQPALGGGRLGSGEQLAALATHLRASGAVFYGAYWCSHCRAQKEMFGPAAAQLPYVECDARGADAQPAACQAAGVRAYPTWVINGQKIEGEVPVTELARLSGFIAP